jgi:hypothetical protein
MRWNLVLAGLFLVSSLQGQACVASVSGDAVLAMNPATGEAREFATQGDVPDGWVTCDENGCPAPLPCGDVDESACIVRADCAPLYTDGAFEGCVDGGATTCPIEACGPALGMPSFDCWDGSIGGSTGRCIEHDGGVCGWEVLECPPPPACQPEDCGLAPGMPNWPCDDGSAGGPACIPATDGACGWAILECPEAGTCDDITKCGPALGMPAFVCEDGSVGGNTGQCLDNGDGTCSWEIRECPGENPGN